MAESISRQQLALMVRDKKTMYETLTRNQVVMPAYKQRICTLKFMWDVRSGRYWAPKTGDVADATLVAKPPTRLILAAALKDAITHLVVSEELDDATTDPIIATVDLI